MEDPTIGPARLSERDPVSGAARVQILATEHWSLLATRNLTYNEMFSRASMFVTVLSAAVVSLALVAQATHFGAQLHVVALMLLSIVLLIGVATFVRLGEANTDDIRLVMAMNRLRHAYLELAPELEAYFTTGHHDDHAGILQSYGPGYRLSVGRVLAGTPSLVAAINAVLVGSIAALIADLFAASARVSASVGVCAALVAAAAHGLVVLRAIRRGRLGHQARFPSGE